MQSRCTPLWRALSLLITWTEIFKNNLYLLHYNARLHCIYYSLIYLSPAGASKAERVRVKTLGGVFNYCWRGPAPGSGRAPPGPSPGGSSPCSGQRLPAWLLKSGLSAVIDCSRGASIKLMQSDAFVCIIDYFCGQLWLPRAGWQNIFIDNRCLCPAATGCSWCNVCVTCCSARVWWLMLPLRLHDSEQRNTRAI